NPDRAVKTKEPDAGASQSKKQPTSQQATLTTTVVDDIQFTDAGTNVPRDIHLSNNNSGLLFYGTVSPLTVNPSGAAIQFWGNNSGFPGQLFLDSGAFDQAALIFRTAGSGGTVTERMRVTAAGNVGIGVTNPGYALDVGARMRVRQQVQSTDGAGIFF